MTYPTERLGERLPSIVHARPYWIHVRLSAASATAPKDKAVLIAEKLMRGNALRIH